MVSTAILTVTNNAVSIIATAFAVARLYVRGCLLRSLNTDDVFLVLAVVSALGGYGVLSWMDYGSFTHGLTPDRTHLLADNTDYYYWQIAALHEAAMAIYTLQNMFSRLSLLFSYRRIATRDTMRNQRRAISTIIVIVLCFGLGFTYAELFPCWPPKLMRYPDYWQFKPDGKSKYYCLATRQIWPYATVIGVFMDAMVYGMPYFLLGKAKIRRKQKMAIQAMFAFGFVVLALSGVRIPFIWPLKWESIYTIHLHRLMIIWILTLAEANGLIIAACIPTLRPLVRQIKHFFQKRREMQRLHSSMGSLGRKGLSSTGQSRTMDTGAKAGSSNGTVDQEKAEANTMSVATERRPSASSVYASTGRGDDRESSMWEDIPMTPLDNQDVPLPTASWYRRRSSAMGDTMQRVEEEDESNEALRGIETDI